MENPKQSIKPFLLLHGQPRYLLLWVLISLFVVIVDILTGPAVRFPIIFTLPVLLCSWFNGFIPGLLLALILPVARLVSFDLVWRLPWNRWELLLNDLIQTLTFLVLALLASYAAEQQRQVRILRGFLPICSFCKRIRNDQGSWQQMEEYISQHSEAKFSHGLCQDCLKAQYGMDPSGSTRPE